jgi:hypothetical protein
MLFVTTDGCQNILAVKPPFKPSEISIDPQNVDVLIGSAENDPKKRLWISTDFGLRWEAVEEYIEAVAVGKETLDVVDGRKNVLKIISELRN